MSEILAHDRIGSVRVTDEDGRLYVARTHISKANVCPYRGSEIPGADALGLEPDRVYQLLRDPEELARAAPTFNAIPVLADHAHVSADNPRRDITVGATGTDCAFADPYLDNALAIWDADAIAMVRDGGRRELSCAYRYDADMTPGRWRGQPYDGVMRNIRGNHVALVPAGRAGPDVLVADSQPKDLKMTQKTPAQMAARLHAAVKAGKLAMDASPEAIAAVLAADEDNSGVPAAATMADDETPEEKAEREKREKEAMDKAAKDKAAKDAEIEEAEKARAAKDKSAKDEEDEKARKDKEAEDKCAQDRAIKIAVDAALTAERARTRAADEARLAVRPLVGDVIGMDSADEIYRYALKERGIAADGVNTAGLKALVSVQAGAISAPPVIAADSASDFNTRFGVSSAPRKL